MPSPTTSVADAQQDIRHAYFNGAPGMLASATAWFIAGLFAVYATPQHAVIALFVGGVCIHPVGVLLTKAFGRAGSHARGNPLGPLALESTGWLIFSLPLAFVVSRCNADWFFPAMLLIIGGRYLTFATLFGMRVFWVCGATLGAAAYLLVTLHAQMPIGAFTGAAIEAVFALIILAGVKRDRRD